MIILNQEKTAITDDMNIHKRKDGESYVISSLKMPVLGKYKTEERANEVFYDIIKAYNIDVRVFSMPAE